MRAILLTLLLLLSLPALAGTPAIGDAPPALLGKDNDGNEVRLETYRGKVVVVTFWASWCGYCLKELPALDALQAQAGDQLFKVIAVNVEDGPAQYRAMMRQMRDFTLLLARDRSGDIAASYGVKGYPDLWIIDPQGKVAAHHRGYGEDSLEAVITEIKQALTRELQRQQATTAG